MYFETVEEAKKYREESERKQAKSERREKIVNRIIGVIVILLVFAYPILPILVEYFTR